MQNLPQAEASGATGGFTRLWRRRRRPGLIRLRPLWADFAKCKIRDKYQWLCGRPTLCLILLLVCAGLARAAVRHDFDGDGKADPVLYDPLCQWLVFLSGSGYASATVGFEGIGLAPIAADFDGDGRADPACYDESNAVFYTRLSGNHYDLVVLTGLGGAGFTPVEADFDGDRKADPALYCETEGVWLALLSTQDYASSSVSGFGGSGCAPALADYDGDLQTDLAVYQGDTGKWVIRTSRDGAEHELALGDADCIPVHGDFDGDGLDDPVVYRETDGVWAVRLSSSGTIVWTTFGGWDMKPAAGDYAGDGKTEPVLRCAGDGRWVVRKSDGDVYWNDGSDNSGAMYPDSLGPHPVDEDKPLPYTRVDWMRHLNDNKYLSEISIPGTHDTGADLHTSRQGVLADYAITQDFRLANQLRLGVRWFDIRLFFDGELSVYHGFCYLHKSFDDMLQPALEFLKTGSTGACETVVFMINQEYSSASDQEFGAAVYARLQAHGLDNFYLQNKVPTLGEARGKIMIVRRFDNTPGTNRNFGIKIDWPDNTKGWANVMDGISFYAQDHYILKNVHSSEKISQIENTISMSHLESDPKKFYLNFVSGQRVERLQTLPATACEINPDISAYLRDYSHWRRCGVIMVDFAGGTDNKKGLRSLNPELIQRIIKLNDGVP
jgi:1-phosphatidylinositol phosphodiesterase